MYGLWCTFLPLGMSVGNRPPEFQDAMYKGKWKEAYEILTGTNDFPEFAGRICPALCEKSCVLKLSMDAPVTIREDEAAIIEAAFREGTYSLVNMNETGSLWLSSVPDLQDWPPPIS